MKTYFLILSLFLTYSLNAAISISGRVYDAVSNIPIPFATIMIFDSQIGAITNIGGEYTFQGLPPGEYRIQVSIIGYKSVVTEAQFIRFGTKIIDIGLQASYLELEEFTVEVNPFVGIDEAPLAFRRISSAEIDMNPGANRDISKVVQSFPGVAGSTAFRNDLIVRGGGPSENTYYLEGIEIPNLNHFATQGASGGPVGIINADLIREVDFLSSAFPANRGDALSSVLDFKMVDGSDQHIFNMALGASEISAEALGKIGDNSNYVVSARRSYLQFLFSALGLPFLPTFNDLTFKVETKITPRDEIMILGIGAYDKNVLNLDAPVSDENTYTLSTIPYQTQWNYTLGVSYKHYYDNSYLNLVVSHNNLHNYLYKYLDNENDDPTKKILDYNSDEGEIKSRLEHVHRTGPFKFVSGAGLERASYTNATEQQVFVNGLSTPLQYDSKLTFVKYSLFEQATFTSFGELFTASVGVRLDGNTYADNMKSLLHQVSPRIALSYAVAYGLKLNANVGRFHQLPAYTTLGYQDNSGRFVNRDNGIKPISSTHYGLGVEWMIANHAVFSAEGFFKQYQDYPMSLQDSVSLASKGGGFDLYEDEEVASLSDGQAYGMEMMVRWNGHKGLNFVMAYTWVNSQFTDLRTGDYQPSAWDNKHLLSLTGTKMLKRSWAVGAKFRMQGGAPYTPVDVDKSELVEAWDATGVAYLDYSRFNEERLKTFSQLDLRVDKTFYFDSKWMLGVYFDVQNVLGRTYQSPASYVQEKDASGVAIIENPNAPIAEQRYKLKAIEQTSGTVLPTIGIMISF